MAIDFESFALGQASGEGGGSAPVLEVLNAAQNGDYLPGEGVDGFSAVHVGVPGGAKVYSISGSGSAASAIPDGCTFGISTDLAAVATATFSGTTFTVACIGFDSSTGVVSFYGIDPRNTAWRDTVEFTVSDGSLTLTKILANANDMSSYIPSMTWTVTVFDNRSTS